MDTMPLTASASREQVETGRVRAITINLQPCDNLDALRAEVLSALGAAAGLDLIVLPESCRGVGADAVEPVDGPTVAALAEIARRSNSYVLAGLYLTHDSDDYVSSVLIDRSGGVVGTYDKRYPYWSDLDVTPQPRPGSDVPIWHTDFGALGAAICFDVNFPQVWADLADAGVDLVVWPSAYSGGSILRSYAQIHHFHVLTCTQAGDSHLYDPLGIEVVPASQPRDRVSVFEVDLGRGFYHHNFNLSGLERLMAEHADDVRLDAMLSNEEWFVLSPRHGGVNVRDLAGRYGLEELRAYIRRSRHAIDQLRTAPRPHARDAATAGRR